MITEITAILKHITSFFQYQDPLFSMYLWQYLAIFIIFFGGKLIFSILLRIFLHRLIKQEEYIFFVKRIQNIHAYTLALILLTKSIPYLELSSNNALISNIILALNFTCSILLVFFAYRIVDIAFLYFRNSLPEDSKRNLYFLPFFKTLTKITITIVSLVTLPSYFIVYDVSNILGKLSINITVVTTAIAFSLRDTIHNFIGGGTVIIDKMFKEGDRISINDVEGVVKRLDLRTTEVETDNKSIVSIPNATFTNKQLVNYGHVTRESFTMQFFIDDLNTSSLDNLLKGFYQIVEAHPEAIAKKCNVQLELIAGNEFTLNFDLGFQPISERQNILYSCDIVTKLKKIASSMKIKIQS
ncbi:MAG: mechanosensitive ion channel domain-containing protein [Bacteroidota bacterium]